MFEVKKQISIEINITQEGLEDLIKEKIKEKDPTIIVDSIKFINRRSPPSLEVEIEAHAEGQTVTTRKPLVEKEESVASVKGDTSDLETTEEAQPEAVELLEEVKPKKTMKSLFDS